MTGNFGGSLWKGSGWRDYIIQICGKCYSGFGVGKYYHEKNK